MNATPKPWKVIDGDIVVGPKGNVVALCKGCSVKATDPSKLAKGGREDNAALIVLSVNNHDALVEAVLDILPDLRHYAATHGPGPDKRLAAVLSALTEAGIA